MYTFDDIVGNNFIINSIQKSIAGNKTAHAYIIDGKGGSGKKLLASTFAKTLQCEKGGDTPCGECISCRAFDDGNHPDIVYVTPKKTQSLGVDDIREQINSVISVKPYKYKYKIFMIHNADKMTVQAQNALLKTIEEPPNYGVFLLLSSNSGSFLPTILSRCVLYKIKPLSYAEVKQYLSDRGFDDDTTDVYSAYSGGSIGHALKLAQDEEFSTIRNDVLNVFKGFDKAGISGLFLKAKDLEKYKDQQENILDIIYLWYRDALIYKACEDTNRFIQKDKINDVVQFCENIPLKLIAGGIDAVYEAKVSLKYNANYRLVLEVMLMKMAGALT